jgi:hypothetical protein
MDNENHAVSTSAIWQMTAALWGLCFALIGYKLWGPFSAQGPTVEQLVGITVMLFVGFAMGFVAALILGLALSYLEHRRSKMPSDEISPKAIRTGALFADAIGSFSAFVLLWAVRVG